MTIPTKKLHNGFEIPVFGLGTWLMGGTKVKDPHNDDAAQIQSIQNAIEMGITHIDTAENYAEGWAEHLVGEAIKPYDRKKLFITTKVDKNHLHHDDVIAAANASLDRLQTDYLDLYLIHSPNDEVPMQETMQALDELVAHGLVKNIGVSNFKTSRLVEAQKYTKNKIVVNQVFYNLIMREPEVDLLQYCQQNDVILEAYRPLKVKGVLDNPPSLLTDIAHKYGKTPAQIVLNWLVSQDNVVTISKAANEQHMKENIEALGFQMNKEDIERLRTEFPGATRNPDDFPLR